MKNENIHFVIGIILITVLLAVYIYLLIIDFKHTLLVSVLILLVRTTKEKYLAKKLEK